MPVLVDDSNAADQMPSVPSTPNLPTLKTAVRSWIKGVANSALSLAVIGAILAGATFAHQRIQQNAAIAAEAAKAALTTTAVPVRTEAAVAQGAFYIPHSYVGLVVPSRSVSLEFEVSGRVSSRNVSVGDRVQEGDVLATLDQRRIEANLINARAARERAQAVLDLREAEANRMDTLSSSGIVTQQAFDQALSNRQAARADLDSANAQLRALEIDFEDTRLRAPFDAEITAVNFDLGDVVSPDRQILTMTSAGRAEARIGLPVDVAERFSVGDSVSIVHRSTTMAAEIGAVVSRVTAATQTIDLVIEFPESVQAIEGERVTFLSQQRIEQHGFWVPLDALVSDLKGLFAVQIAAEATGEYFEIARAPVIVHFTDGERAFVSGALASGDQIVTEGTNRVSPGQSVVFASREGDR